MHPLRLIPNPEPPATPIRTFRHTNIILSDAYWVRCLSQGTPRHEDIFTERCPAWQSAGRRKTREIEMPGSLGKLVDTYVLSAENFGLGMQILEHSQVPPCYEVRFSLRDVQALSYRLGRNLGSNGRERLDEFQPHQLIYLALMQMDRAYYFKKR